jgi:hypothetical protein
MSASPPTSALLTSRPALWHRALTVHCARVPIKRRSYEVIQFLPIHTNGTVRKAVSCQKTLYLARSSEEIGSYSSTSVLFARCASCMISNHVCCSRAVPPSEGEPESHGGPSKRISRASAKDFVPVLDLQPGSDKISFRANIVGGLRNDIHASANNPEFGPWTRDAWFAPHAVLNCTQCKRPNADVG